MIFSGGWIMLPVFKYPGVYIEELPSAVHRITGLATPIAAFVGWAPQGPVNQATLVQSWRDYQAQFGGLDPRSKLGNAVHQFFANGGQQLYVVRVATTPPPGEAGLAALLNEAIANIPRRFKRR
jgi:phage tail sheath protein FI